MRSSNLPSALVLVGLTAGLTAGITAANKVKGATWADRSYVAEATRHFDARDCAVVSSEAISSNEAAQAHNTALDSQPAVSTAPVTFTTTSRTWTKEGCGMADYCMVETKTTTTGVAQAEARQEVFTGRTLDTWHLLADGALFMAQDDGSNGLLIANRWSDGDGAHYFWKVDADGYELILPGDPKQRGFRRVFLDVTTIKGANGTIRPDGGQPAAICTLVDWKSYDADPSGPCAIPPRPEAPPPATIGAPSPLPAGWGTVDGQEVLTTSSYVPAQRETFASTVNGALGWRTCLTTPAWVTTADGRQGVRFETRNNMGDHSIVLFVPTKSGAIKQISCSTYGPVRSQADLDLWNQRKASCDAAIAAESGG